MDFVLQRGTADPVSAQIARRFERAIREGDLLPGERLPSVRILRRRLGVAFNTVLRAYTDLARAGLAYSIPAKGVYVAHDAPPPPVPDDQDWDGKPGRERRNFIRLSEALIVQSERCGYEIDDALAEVRARAGIRRSRIERYVKEHKGRRTLFERSYEERQALIAAEEAAQREVDLDEIRAGLAKERARKEEAARSAKLRRRARQLGMVDPEPQPKKPPEGDVDLPVRFI